MFSKNGSWHNRHFLKAVCIEGGWYVLPMVFWNKVCIPAVFRSTCQRKFNSAGEKGAALCSLHYFSVKLLFFFLKKFRDISLWPGQHFYCILPTSEFSDLLPDCLKATNNPNYHFISYPQLDTHTHTTTSILALLWDFPPTLIREKFNVTTRWGTKSEWASLQ